MELRSHEALSGMISNHELAQLFGVVADITCRADENNEEGLHALGQGARVRRCQIVQV